MLKAFDPLKKLSQGDSKDSFSFKLLTNFMINFISNSLDASKL